MKHIEQLDLFFDYVKEKIIDKNHKTCSACKETKKIKYFGKREKFGKSLRKECRSCEYEKKKIIKELKVFNPKPTDPYYNCPCCKKTEEQLTKYNQFNGKTVWVLDHNHDTNEFRGWICNNCNNALGRFQDNTEILKNALKYLEENNK